MPDSQGLFAELQRRHVIRAAIGHVVFFWLLVQVADVVLPYIGVVDEPVRWALVTGVALLPVTLLLAWFFEHPWHKQSGGRVFIDIVVIAAIAVAAGFWVTGNLPQVIHTRTSIVILPFEHSGSDRERGLSRALAFEINGLLLRSKAIDVIGVETSNSSLLNGLGAVAVANRLSVNNVLTGSVALTGDSMRIEARLLDAAGQLIWNSVVEETVGNLFSTQEKIAVGIASRLGAGPDAVPIETVAGQRCWKPADPDALEDYYTARYFIELRSEDQRSLDQIGEAIEVYTKLIVQYPKFSDARSGLAWALIHRNSLDEDSRLPDEVLDVRVRELASQALDDCPGNGEAMHILPNEHDHENDWIGSHQQLQAFIEMQPDRLENYQRLSYHYRTTGHHKRAIEVAEKNYALNPLSPKALSNLADAYVYVGRFDEAIALYDEAAELGSLGENYGHLNKVIDACKGNFQCVFDAGVMPPMMSNLLEPMRIIQREPANDEEAKQSIEAALALHIANPHMVTNMLNVMPCDYEHLTPLFFELWEQNEAMGEQRGFWFWPNVWLPRCGAVWSDERFPAFVEEQGFVEYWREVGWPEACQPQGESFTCGSNARAAK